ncbi:hypothetical protein ACQ4M3_13040 [Leptolyngbya sp. AN03gr2]|uniref:hypothetical protein n=1 Tax=unclassified Leptolyngbya TaxID=2650499 RepID=UPI003D31D685
MNFYLVCTTGGYYANADYQERGYSKVSDIRGAQIFDSAEEAFRTRETSIGKNTWMICSEEKLAQNFGVRIQRQI